MKKFFLTLALSIISNTIVLAEKPLVVAHRGLWDASGSAQNSIAALRMAADAGCYASEFDVWLTADNGLVVNHDNVVDGVRIETAKLDEAKALKLANGENMPTLAEYLDEAILHPDLHLILELKPLSDFAREDKAAAMVMQMLNDRRLTERTTIISFSINACLAFRKINENIPIQYLNGDLPPESVQKLKLNGIDYSMRTLRNNPEWIDRAHKCGILVNAWTVTEPEHLLEFIDRGVDMITTNAPQLLIEMLQHDQNSSFAP